MLTRFIIIYQQQMQLYHTTLHRPITAQRQLHRIHYIIPVGATMCHKVPLNLWHLFVSALLTQRSMSRSILINSTLSMCLSGSLCKHFSNTFPHFIVLSKLQVTKNIWLQNSIWFMRANILITYLPAIRSKMKEFSGITELTASEFQMTGECM